MYACAMMLLRDEDEAADCVQDALIRLWESRSRLAEIEKPEAYCLTAVKRQALDAIRRRGRMQESNVDISNIDLPGSLTPHDEAVARDDLRLACQLIGQLAPRQREVVELSALSGYDNAEIAAATGISDENIRVLLSRGRSRLRELFRKNRNR
jgi:RNA polymerase sigma-70 factor (ECF subfamily)